MLILSDICPGKKFAGGIGSLAETTLAFPTCLADQAGQELNSNAQAHNALSIRIV